MYNCKYSISDRKKVSDSGLPKKYTLINFLVALLIMTLLAAVKLPSFPNQIAKDQRAKGRNTFGAVNQVKPAYRTNSASFRKGWRVS